VAGHSHLTAVISAMAPADMNSDNPNGALRDGAHGHVDIHFFLKDFLKSVFGRILANGQTIRWATQKPVLKKLMEQIPKGGTAVDIGCGGGTYSIELLAPRFERILAADLNWDHARLTKRRALQRGLQNIHVVVASGDQLPFASDIANFVLCCEVLEHIPNDEVAMSEFFRIGITNNSRVICSVPCPPEPFDNPEHVRDGYDPSELNNKLKNAGFSVENVRYCMFTFSRKTIRWCSMTTMPLPLLFLCQIEHLISSLGVSLSNPYDMIVLAQSMGLTRNVPGGGPLVAGETSA
jgi:ubiquinone/menaquinone biosynthesis C-methylase UbiE